MATQAQIVANQRNAAKSTGPMTEEGKARSRLNAVDHGLASVLPDAAASRAFIEERKDAWRGDLKPVGETQEHVFEQVVIESIRIERCQEVFFSLCKQHGDRARVQWDADRRREAEELAAGLAKSPQVVTAKLEATPQGCGVKLVLWTGLLSSLSLHRDWTDNQRSLALDLLGVHRDLRDAETPIDPENRAAFEVRLTVVNTEIARLTDLRDRVLIDLDADDRAVAETTLGAEFTKPMQLLDRYERACSRRQASAWRKLNAAQREGNPVAPTAPVPKVATSARKLELPREIQTLPTVAIDPPQPEVEPSYSSRASRLGGLNRRQRRMMEALDRRAG